jgi:hypothetical protein
LVAQNKSKNNADRAISILPEFETNKPIRDSILASTPDRMKLAMEFLSGWSRGIDSSNSALRFRGTLLRLHQELMNPRAYLAEYSIPAAEE